MKPALKGRLVGWRLAGALALSMALLPLAGCKQGEGQRCQVDSDCQSGLTCNASTQRCQKPGGSGADGGLPDGQFFPDSTVSDAPPADARPADAAPADAHPDAAADAAPTDAP